MKCEVEGCNNEHVMTVRQPTRFTGTKRICQAHWVQIVKANKEGDALPFKFKERVVV